MLAVKHVHGQACRVLHIFSAINSDSNVAISPILLGDLKSHIPGQ
jgi:hypothetical protein